MRKLSFFMCVLLLLVGSSCIDEQQQLEKIEQAMSNPELFHNSLDQLTDIIVHDIFSPPVASRVYVYPCVAAYETLAQKYTKQQLLSNQLQGLGAIPQPADTVNLSYELAALAAFMQVGQTLIFSELKMEEYREAFLADVRAAKVPEIVISKSMSYGDQVAAHILAWADKDNYKETRSSPKYNINDEPGTWKPTPPAYMEGIEPHWRDIRTMVLENAGQFKPAAPPAYDMNEKSDFYQKTVEVMDAVNNATEEHVAIASFWDCNPYVMNQTGHMMYASKKITPGGHWMGIANIASETAGHDMMQTIETATMTSIALFDAFISCWDEKYRSNLIRPETVINEHIDETWKPILQTPPFPEHTSGHSVISNAAAIVLTDLLGETFAYEDDVEVKYGLPVRSYTSFLEAADEAAISRLYGGIHYMPAIEDGVSQGRKVGNYIVMNISTKK
ncbi:MAG: vanadium-dependent haloperoxidase [Bacteroidota bacterium]